MTVLNINAIYLNRSLADLPGEVWKDVPGFEDTTRHPASGG
ncbi:hypothetical protein [Mucilaginibacter sp. 3215]